MPLRQLVAAIGWLDVVAGSAGSTSSVVTPRVSLPATRKRDHAQVR